LVAGLDLGDGRWVTVVRDRAGARWTVPLVLADGAVRRAVPGDGVAEALVARLLEAAPTGSAAVVAGATPPSELGADPALGEFVLTRWAGQPAHGERAISVDQTNESVIVGDAAVVKWCLHLPPAGSAIAHPAARRLAALAEQGFADTPTPWGLLEVHLPDEGPVVLATIAAFLPGSSDGWDWAVEDVTAHAHGDLDEAASLLPPRELGRLTADLHVALATAGTRPATAAEVSHWQARGLAALDEAIELIDGPEGERLRALAPAARRALAGLAELEGTPLLLTHGDLHVGQVLRHGDPAAYAITDFDGNPVLPAAERADPAPAALDVASMLASLDHVGRVVHRRLDEGGAGAAAARLRVTAWIEAAEAAFLDEYRATLEAVGATELFAEQAVPPLRVQQECREFLYAAHHLPHWRYVPDAALPALLSSRP
ncbi:MAG: hypothetical protein ACTHJJ_06950, partial [Intrasporangium sp.]|uniref:hypothetical protein n=1 Tax=Intrasporangium sp. TaxID=1925024 RepID=UPI003F7FA817